MKLGKIYECPQHEAYVQKISETEFGSYAYFNIISLSEGMSIKVLHNETYYIGKHKKISKQKRQWFLDSIVAGEVLPQEDYKSEKDKLIDELLEQNHMLVEALEDLCPGFSALYLTETIKEI